MLPAVHTTGIVFLVFVFQVRGAENALRCKTYASVRPQLKCALVWDLPPEFYDVIGVLVVLFLILVYEDKGD